MPLTDERKEHHVMHEKWNTSGSPLTIEFSSPEIRTFMSSTRRLALINKYLFLLSSDSFEENRVDAKWEEKSDKKSAHRTISLQYYRAMLCYALGIYLYILYVCYFITSLYLSSIYCLLWWLAASEMFVPICLWQTATCYWIGWTSWTRWNACCLS